MISSEEMRELEDRSGISKSLLMERAGKGIANTVREKFDLKDKQILIVSYHGNNGGDGFVAARELADHAEVDLMFIGDEAKLKEEASLQYKKIENDPRIQMLSQEVVDFSDYDYIIDAIFGTGLAREVKDPLATLIKNLSRSKAFKISVDVPTGVNPDTGEKGSVYFDPDLLITIHDVKKGLAEYKDKTVIIDIGIASSPKEEPGE